MLAIDTGHSHTFALRRRIPLDEIWKVFDKDGVARMLQSPRKIQTGTFRKLFMTCVDGQDKCPAKWPA